MNEEREYLRLLIEEKYEDADRLMETMIPARLYKFIPLEGDHDQLSLETLASDAMWLSKTNYENDPFEFKYICMDRDKLLAEGQSEHVLNHIEKVVDFKDSFVMGCLSANTEQNPAMWGHYNGPLVKTTDEKNIVNRIS